jgi:hypothetical protein
VANGFNITSAETLLQVIGRKRNASITLLHHAWIPAVNLVPHAYTALLLYHISISASPPPSLVLHTYNATSHLPPPTYYSPFGVYSLYRTLARSLMGGRVRRETYDAREGQHSKAAILELSKLKARTVVALAEAKRVEPKVARRAAGALGGEEEGGWEVHEGERGGEGGRNGERGGGKGGGRERKVTKKVASDSWQRCAR